MSPWRDRLVAAGLAGVALAVLDAVAAALLDGPQTGATTLESLAILLLLPGIAVIFCIPLGFLQGRWVLLVPAVPAFFMGGELARGNRASTWPLADHWGWMLGLGVPVVGFFLVRWWSRSSRGLLLCTSICGFLGIVLHLVAALTQRGRYQDVRELAMILAGFLLVVAFTPTAHRFLPRARTAFLVAAFIALSIGTWCAATRQVAADWGLGRGSAVTPWVERIREHLAPELPGVDALEIPLVPFFGSAVARDSLDQLQEPEGVLFITIDAFRADMFGSSRGGRKVTPNLDRLGSLGAVHERAYSPAPGSHHSLFGFFSGRYPSQVVSHPGGFNGIPLVTGRLEAAGVRTRACYSRGLLSIRRGGFDRWDMDFGAATLHPWSDLPVAETYDAVRPKKGERWFSFVHFLTPHYPYAPPEEFLAGSGEFDRYAADIRYADHLVGELLEMFRRDGHLEKAIVVVGSDHGETFMEHGQTRHGGQVYEESVHVPLVAFGGGIQPNRHGECVSLVDIAPTLEHLFRLPGAGRPAYAGRSLVPLWTGTDDPGRLGHVLAEIPPMGHGLRAVQSAVIGPRWKLIVDERMSRVHLHDLLEDPGEQSNKAQEHPDMVKQERRRLLALRDRLGPLDAALYRGLDPAIQLVERGDELDDNEILAHLRRSPEVSPEVLAKYLAYFADGGHPLQVVDLLPRYEQHPDSAVRQACRIMKAGMGTLAQAGLEELVRSFGVIEHPFVVATVYSVFGARRDDRLLGIQTTAGGLVVDLGRARYRFQLKQMQPDADLLRRGLGARSPWIRRLAAELVFFSGNRALVEELLKAHKATQERRALAALTQAVGLAEGKRIDEFLLHRAEMGPIEERRTAMIALARRGRYVTFLPFADPEVARKTTGMKAAPPLRATLLNRRATAPVATFEQGTLLALSLYFSSRAGPNPPAVRVSLGSWFRDVVEPPLAPDLPCLFWVPAGISVDSLELEVLRGDPSLVVWGGAASLPLRTGSRPFDTRRY